MGLFKKIGTGVGLGAIAPLVAGPLLGVANSALAYKSAQEQNKSNETMAKDSMAFSADQARQQMEFQERMSNTAHQREVEDLRKAGLNPLLSLNSGSSTPTGAAGTGATAPVVPELSAITTSAMDLVNLYSNFRASAAATDASKAQAAKTRTETVNIGKQEPQRRLDSKIYNLLNRMFDGLFSSAKEVNKRQSRVGSFNSESNNALYMSDDQLRSNMRELPLP